MIMAPAAGSAILVGLRAYTYLPGALDAANERLLYEQAAAAQIDVVSVGKREGLLPFHDVLLELLGNGQWRTSRPVTRPTPG